MSKDIGADVIANELKQGSVFFQPQNPKRATKPTRKTVVKSTEVPKSVSTELPNSRSAVLPKLRTYEVPNFKRLKRLDVRLTREQRRYLEDLEDQIREHMPEGERDDPENRRVTKASIVRVFVEIFRQLDLQVDPKGFKNELDLMNALFTGLKQKIRKSVSSELTKF